VSGCFWDRLFPPEAKTLPNQIALARALHLSSLTESDRPFHLILDVPPPPQAITEPHAEVEVFWINAITWRAVIRSNDFNQVRIRNGSAIEEHSIGTFYPRWIQNFADALFEPVPDLAVLEKIPGSVPISHESHACIVAPESAVQACFQGNQPLLASGRNPSRYVAFDDFSPFGSQQIPRTLVSELPGGILLRGHIVRLEPLSQGDYSIVQAREFTLPVKQLQTVWVSPQNAEALLESTPTASPDGAGQVYIRTDRTGQVREAYPESTAQNPQALRRALALKFKPLIVNGSAQQMETTFLLR
jgi:hypothetical protein